MHFVSFSVINIVLSVNLFTSFVALMQIFDNIFSSNCLSLLCQKSNLFFSKIEGRYIYVLLSDISFSSILIVTMKKKRKN